MIFCRDRVSYDDFGDCHDEIIVAGVDFIGKWSIYGLYLQGEPLRGQQLQVIDLIVDGGREEFKVLR
jgi:hypothetical protein